MPSSLFLRFVHVTGLPEVALELDSNNLCTNLIALDQFRHVRQIH